MSRVGYIHDQRGSFAKPSQRIEQACTDPQDRDLVAQELMHEIYAPSASSSSAHGSVDKARRCDQGGTPCQLLHDTLVAIASCRLRLTIVHLAAARSVENAASGSTGERSADGWTRDSWSLVRASTEQPAWARAVWRRPAGQVMWELPAPRDAVVHLLTCVSQRLWPRGSNGVHREAVSSKAVS
jgi:hypothetical protein